MTSSSYINIDNYALVSTTSPGNVAPKVSSDEWKQFCEDAQEKLDSLEKTTKLRMLLLALAAISLVAGIVLVGIQSSNDENVGGSTSLFPIAVVFSLFSVVLHAKSTGEMKKLCVAKSTIGRVSLLPMIPSVSSLKSTKEWIQFICEVSVQRESSIFKEQVHRSPNCY